MSTATAPASLPASELPGAGQRHRLLISCPDRAGIVAEVSGFLRDAGANILSSDQYSTDPQGGTFFMRMEFALALTPQDRSALESRFAAAIGEPFGMAARFHDAAVPKRVAIMVSRYDHCLLDLLWRSNRGELPVDVGVVVSNWSDLRAEVERFDLPYHEIPVTRDTKPAAEAAQLEVLGGGRYDLVVMARYMQILSDDFLRQVGCPVINIHHSFLPAFAGAGPYERAKERGVKLIGATAHYATADLDEGPIIEQDVVRVTHRDDAAELTRLGADIERTVLARAVKWHCEDRVLVHGNTTVVF